MHIGIICDEFPPAPHGGTGSSYRDLAHGLAAAGHKVTVVGVYRQKILDLLPPDTATENLRIVRLPSSPLWLRYRLQMLADRWRLKHWLAREHLRNPFTVIECSDYGGWLSSGGPNGVVTITRMRGSNLFFDHELERKGDPFEHGLERKCVMRATALGAVSQYAARQTLALCGLTHRAATVIYNAVDTDLFSPANSIKTEPGLIVFVNTINPKKGIEQLVEAMNLLCPLYPQARLAIVGADTQKADNNGQSYVEKLRARVRPEFRSHIEFTGRLDRQTGVVDFLRRAHVCCLPSHMETFGIAAAEAMSVCKPVIYSRTGPGPEVMENGVSGLLCDPYDAGDIASKIGMLFDQPQFADQLAVNARRRVLEKFNKADWIPRNVSFFQSCITAVPCQ